MAAQGEWSDGAKEPSKVKKSARSCQSKTYCKALPYGDDIL